MQKVNNKKVEVIQADSSGNVIENIKGYNVITSCTHPIVNQIRHYYTKWIIHPFVSSKGEKSEKHDKLSVQVGYCKVCDKIVMSEGQEWSILEKQAKEVK